MDKAGYGMFASVASADFHEAGIHGQAFAVGAGGHVAIDEGLGEFVAFGGELGGEFVGEATLLGFDEGAGVVSDQPAESGVGVVGVA